MDVGILIIISALSLIFLLMYLYLYNVVAISNQYVNELTQLTVRTFREYYKGEDIEPIAINNGIELVWKGDVDGVFNDDNTLGFITIYTNEDSLNSPIRDRKEADIIGGKIINLIYEYISDRDN